jgi:hypothetical protein
MNNIEKENLHRLFDKHKDNLELCLNYEDLEYIAKTKKDFDKNNLRAINKYRNKIKSQTLKCNLL